MFAYICIMGFKKGNKYAFKKGHKFKHGYCYHPAYRTHIGMMARCYNTKANAYDLYGGRGIEVWKEWHDIAVFIAYAEQLPNYLKEGYTLDRIDGDGNYEPNNIRFADKLTQVLNSRISKTNKTGYKGVSIQKGKTIRYNANVCYKHKHTHIGTFGTIIEAVKARNQFIVDNGFPHKIQEIDNKSVL